MKYEIEKLKEGLKKLTGADYESAEKAERALGNITPLINFSTPFQIRLAAMALGTNPPELKTLPINEYSLLATTVSNFLLTGSEATEEQPQQSEKL